MDINTVRFAAPGPVAARFQASTATVRGLMGPYGSAKTSTCLTDLLWKAQQQRPGPDGWRHFKGLVVRDTYRNLEKTTIPSWHRWMPKESGQWLGGEGGRPAKHVINFQCPADGLPLNFALEFVGLNENKVEDVLRGYEVSAAYLNEADLLDPDVLTFVLGRIGRYPPSEPDAPARWSGVVCDFNAPDTENWTYKYFIETPGEGVEFYRQPGGLEPGAENLQNLPGGRAYYERQLANPDWWVRRYVHNQFGFSREGKPVFPEYNDGRHVAPAPLMPAPGVPLTIGADAGGTPAVLIGQRMPNGQWRILDEIVCAPDATMGPKRTGEAVNRLLAEERYKRAFAGFVGPRHEDRFQPLIIGYGDPSAFYGADKEAGERSWMEMLAHVTEIRIKPAPSNEIHARLEAVRRPLISTIDGTLPGLVISPRCPVLRKGFNSGYRYRKVQLAGSDRFEDKPEKNSSSHPHDALQYMLLGGGEYLEVTGRRERRERARFTEPAAPAREYNPFTDWNP